MELKYKKRDKTKYIRVLFVPDKKTVKEIYTEQRKEGLFNIGYHYILMPDGVMEDGIPFYAYADYRLAHTLDSIYVLAVGCVGKEDLSSSQKKALKDLASKNALKTKYEE